MTEQLHTDIYGVEEQDEYMVPDYRIKDEGDAARYAYGLTETEKEIMAKKAIADAERAKWLEKIAQVDAWEQEVVTPLEEKCDYMRGLLIEFHTRTFNEADEKGQKKLKSIKLPYGITLKSRQPAVKIEVIEEKQGDYETYARENGFVKPQADKFDWAGMKKTLKAGNDGAVVVAETGEIVEFAKSIESERVFEVK